MFTTAFGEELLRIQPADPFMDQSIVTDHGAGVLLPLAGAVGQVVDVDTYMFRRQLLHQNITCETDEGSQRIAVGTDGLVVQANHAAIE